MLVSFPKKISTLIISCYIIALVIVTIVFNKAAMSALWWFWGLTEVLLFCIGSEQLTKRWRYISVQNFERKLFWWSFILSCIYVIITYFLYTSLRGEPFEYDPSDGLTYHYEAIWGAEMFRGGHFKEAMKFRSSYFGFSDQGYQLYLKFLYMFIDDSIFITRIIKSIYRAAMALLIYRFSKRNFGENIGRMAGIFIMLLPNFSFYAASHRKEMEMIFLTTLCLERSDYAFRLKEFKFTSWIIPILCVFVSFTFRTALGISLLFAIGTNILFSSDKFLSKKKRLSIAVWGLFGIAVIGGGTIFNEVETLLEARIGGLSGKNIEWRSQYNSYAKYATGAVMAPMIVAVPFPTMVDIPGQGNQQRLNGGYFIKNVLAIFVIFSIIQLVRRKEFRKHILLYSYTFCYLLTLAFSNFAHSERFHLPALPFLMIMAAYGICNLNKKEFVIAKYYFPIMIIVAIVWNYIKLAGRGLV